MRLRILCFSVFLIAFATHTLAQEDSTETINSSTLNNFKYLFDIPNVEIASSEKSIGISKAKNLHFTKNKRTLVVKEGKAYWFRLKIHNDLSYKSIHYIFIANNDIARSYAFQNNQLIKRAEAGTHTPTPRLQISNTPYYLELEIEPEATIDVYILTYNNRNVKPNLNFTIEDQSTYNAEILRHRKSILNENFIIVLFLGAVGFIFLFMVFIYFKTYQKLYLFYCLYLLGAIIYSLTRLNRITLIGSLIDYYPLLRPYLNEPIQFFFFAVYNWFALELLEVRRYDKKLAKWVNSLAIIYLAYAVYHFLMMYFTFDHQLRNTLFVVTRCILLPLNAIMGFWVYKKVKSPIVNYFLFGLSAYLVSGLIAFIVDTNFRYLGIYNSLFTAANIFQTGILIEILCFSLAIGYRIKLTDDEKNLSNVKLIEQLKINQELIQSTNIELEKKVEERTNQIVAINKEIEERRLAAVKLDFEKKIAEAEMQALRSQMNPHFLFNSLNSIRYLVMTNEDEKAIEYLNKFSRLIRLILENSRYEVITLDQELEALKLYIDIEANRFGDQLSYHIIKDDDIDLNQINIPPLLLQPFVENAIWHGLMPSKKPEKRLDIRLSKSSEKQNTLNLIIEDNGIGRLSSEQNKSKFKQKKSLGMILTKERIALFNKTFNNNIQFEIIDKPNDEHLSGTRIHFTLFLNQND